MPLIDKNCTFLVLHKKYTILPVADQMTDMILCSLNYFVSGEQLAGTEIPEGRGGR